MSDNKHENKEQSFWSSYQKALKAQKENKKNLTEKKNEDFRQSIGALVLIYGSLFIIPIGIIGRLGMSFGIPKSITLGAVLLVVVGLAIFTAKKLTDKTYGGN